MPRINDIVLRKRGITADTAIRLARFFGTSEQFWLTLQAAYEIGIVKAERGREIERIKLLKVNGEQFHRGKDTDLSVTL